MEYLNFGINKILKVRSQKNVDIADYKKNAY